VHAVLCDALHAHPLEGACADVQRDLRASYAACGELLQQRLVEVQGCGRRSPGAGPRGEHRQVA
jgi:hypothetical protein